jgi:serine/threonine protein kinase
MSARTLSAGAAHKRVDDEAAVPRLSAGTSLTAGYTVLAHLRRGHDLDVYDVWSQERGCRCVAKVPRPDRLAHRATRQRLIREGRLLQRLTHPHIVRAYETLTDPSPIVILETLTGATLKHLITSRERRLPLTAVAYLGLHLCAALHYLHHQGILHLDLKPSNIVSDRGLAKVLDLSIARSPGRGPRGIGTPQYMAPEQVRGGLLSAATDVWGLGLVLFEAATGRQPFDADDADATETRYRQLERRVESVLCHRRVPAIFATAIDRCLDPEPARRPTVDELSALLNRLV